jgi:hypothetical protein
LLKGEEPTPATLTQDPALARDENTARADRESVGAFSPSDLADKKSQINSYQELSQTETAGNILKSQREENTQANLKSAFSDKKPTEPTEAMKVMDEVKNNPRDAENETAMKFIDRIETKLKNPDGSLKTDPESLYGIRAQIKQWLSPEGRRDNPLVAHADTILSRVADGLDTDIERGAGGYKKYLSDYAADSGPIDRMDYLQKAEQGLFTGSLTIGKMNRFLGNIISEQRKGGLNTARSIDAETMSSLFDIRDHLRARDAVAQQSRVHGGGSATALKLGDVAYGAAKNAASTLTDMGIHTAAASALGPFGPLVSVPITTARAAARASKTSAAISAAKKAELERLLPQPNNALQPRQD